VSTVHDNVYGHRDMRFLYWVILEPFGLFGARVLNSLHVSLDLRVHVTV
jgi:hypothetical protein